MKILISRRPILNDWAWVPFSPWINVYFAGVERPAYKKGGNNAAKTGRVQQSIWATVVFCLNTPSRCCTFCSSPIGSGHRPILSWWWCVIQCCWRHRRLVHRYDAPDHPCRAARDVDLDDLRRGRPRHFLAPRAVAEPYFKFSESNRVQGHREVNPTPVRAVGALYFFIFREREGVPFVVRVSVFVLCHFLICGVRLLCAVSSP